MRPVLHPNLTARLARPGVRFRQLPPTSWLALGVLVVLALVAIFGTLLATHNPDALSTDTGGPSAEHWFGTDQSGRDIFSRLVAGTRWSLAIGLGATVLALLAGVVIGSFAATSGRRTDAVVMRVMDVIMAFPGIALAAVLVAVFGRGILVLILAIGFLNMAPVARVVRANVLAQYGEDYVAAEHVIGAKRLFILARHVAVNCAAPILVYCTVTVADAIVFEASLSFIGAGIQPPNPSWGSVLSDGKDLVLTGGWWATLFPGLLILITVLALNILSEGISDAWAAPSARTAKAGEVARKIEAEKASENTAAVLPIEGLLEAGARLAAKARDLPDRRPVLEVKDLAISFPDRHNGAHVLDGVSFTVCSGEVLGLIGESGCGKSLTALSVMGLQPGAARLSGEILFEGEDLLTMKASTRRRHLGHDLSMVYQDALSSLNPAMTIRAQLKQFTRRGGTRTPEELLELVNLDPGRTLRSYPHELSGGQRQRVLIAMALSRSPKLIVADEPTTALDVTVQAQVIKLLLRLQEELGFALILVSHDLALVSDVADRVVVMYGGQVAETGTTAEVVGSPRHHYTRGLLSAVLSLEENEATLTQIKGVVPAPADFPPGCRFADRCPAARGHCFEVTPEPEPTGAGHLVACHYPAERTTPAVVEGAQL
ncbi:dipeptide/oligopeptide/nickel ABC transporter permease/ATP-binding protein [Amycolatopsis sp. FDAARGOS 1241]|uniref:dipeptide/oligopeptide/nickel ABC transporter permease/ATP-binding protein n=1 Tax=Amycolatopsis sp. FDAARGOS 1241 TaxID=2778070 RepID=UPI00194EE898|nr:dipeptide/oligopeptide/nickel ABC transporter permease/ATP-binding protein [Amycolatopsis sp. FDAARGOS 1241]QRP43563.1 dipeptide/oligopeptide/nickel ABC transporter permease/ATP-binding protein [Amycolatopsis sp. FDAARGOS 1241]